MKHNNVSS